MNFNKKLLFIGLCAILTGQIFAFTSGPNDELSLDFSGIESDTIPVTETYGDFLTDPNDNPFDIQPSNVEQVVEYDPESNGYVVYEKIGEEYYRTPVTLTFSEYLEWSRKNEQSNYFNQLSGIGDAYKSKSGILDPISKIDIKDDIVDRLFGGSDVTIKPQGSIDVTVIPFEYQFNGNPNIFADLQGRPYFLQFEPVIQMNVDGGIGNKMNIGFNYNTQATFDFDQKIKLEYDSEQFNEDDIIKKVEAGNVSLPLRSSLIQGAQSLMGLKTELQFGHLRLTALASQQRSRQENLQIQNGAQVQEFEIRPDQYDENRHFFISHYHREKYEETLEDLPYLNTAFRINRLQVWISNDRPEFQENSTMICAISDLAEADTTKLSSKNNDNVAPVDPFPSILLDRDGNILPDNRGNKLYFEKGLETDPMAQRIENTATVLRSNYDLEQTRDFEIFRGRLLSPSEYTFNPELGFISLNIRLKPNQVLGVAYDYYYTLNCDTLYRVGELSEESVVSDVNDDGEVESESVIYIKMLKSSSQNVSHPTWDLMMKNVYALRTSNLTQQDFKFDIFYEDDQGDGSLKKFLPEETIDRIPLLNIFNLDRLNAQDDPQPDGIFDFVPGITVIPRNGSIIFPVLEPFGSSLDSLLSDDPSVADFYKYQELYDSTLFKARNFLEKNKFVMRGEYSSSVSSEIALGAWNLPPGSLRVRAGSQLLVEGQDYEVDYGSGRLRILNEQYLQQGVPLDISYEDNSVFSFQQKSMMGLRADYALGDHANIGATYLRLFERPFTQKVNIGDDPINNRIFGLDFDFSKEVPWITKAVDKLPFYSTKEPSNVLFTAEVAALKPGHNKVVNLSDDRGGVVNLDDFEGAVSGLPLGTQTNRWSLASVPDEWPESQDTLNSNANRALLNWYVIDRTVQGGAQHSYSREINQRELFNRQIPQGQLPNLYTFDLAFYPDERGPYNFDRSIGTDNSAGWTYDENQRRIVLNEPESRWAGITRYMINNDFEATNYEFIDFWMLNPFMDREDGIEQVNGEEGKLIFHLGSVSEDVMKDNLQFFENAIPVADNETPVRYTGLADVPLDIPVNNGFAQENIPDQDLGFDGMTDERERIAFADFIADAEANSAGTSVNEDPANDNFIFYDDPSFEGEILPIRYKRWNNPQGNAPSGTTARVRGNPLPDAEDLNNNKSLDQSERYYKYEISLRNANGEVDLDSTSFITESRAIENPFNGEEEKWYRFRIPLTSGQPINGISGFRSIQFMRMIVQGFEKAKTFRMAEFEMVRNQWRKQEPICTDGVDGSVPKDSLLFSVDAVGLEENRSKLPFNYQIPPGIQRELLANTFANVLQDEKSMSLNFKNFKEGCDVSIMKLTELDLRFFERLQLFVHAEEMFGEEQIKDKDLALYVRVGKDFVNNYYEYEIPLIMSDEEDQTYTDALQVWRPENFMDLALKQWTELKKLRNSTGGVVTRRYPQPDDQVSELLPEDPLPDGHKIYVIGNPTLGFVKGIQVGVRHLIDDDETTLDIVNGEVWINELRATGFKENGGVAGLGRLDIQLADLGNVTVSGNYSSVGWGSLDQKLAERQLDEIIEYDVATNLQLGKFFPSNWGLNIPFYAQYAKQIINPQYDQYALDLTVDEVLEIAQENNEPQDTLQEIRERSQDVTTIKTINFTNVRKERSRGGNNRGAGGRGTDPGSSPGGRGTLGDLGRPGGKDALGRDIPGGAGDGKDGKDGKKKKERKPMPWDISNFSVSYSYTETDHRDPFLEIDNTKDYRAALDYNYQSKFKGFKPFQKIVKAPYLKVIKEINFNPVPNSFSFSTDINRYIAIRRFRLPTTPVFEFDDRLFDWRRRYNLKWDLMRSLKLNFTAENTSIIDELRQVGIKEVPSERDWVDERGVNKTADVTGEQYVKDYWMDNLRGGGRNTRYTQQFNLTFDLPTKNIRVLDWISAKAVYKGNYSWIAGPLITIDDAGTPPGAILQNGQERSLNATMKFDKLYDKVPYFKRLQGGKKSSSRRSRTNTRTEAGKDAGKEGAEEGRKKTKKEREISTVEKLLVRPLLSLRTIKLNYREDLRTLVPGFMLTPELFGLTEGWTAPGWQFVTGLQPNLDVTDPGNFLMSSANKGWINPSPEFNQQVEQNTRQTFDATINFEPWKYVKLDVDFSKTYDKRHTEEFKNKNLNAVEFQQFALNDMGSFEVSYLNLATIFESDHNALFRKFLGNRSTISQRLPNSAEATDVLDNNEFFKEGYLKTSTTVMIPAFLSAYTDIDPNQVTLDIEETVRNFAYIPKPNWKLRYDGLTKIPRFKEIFSSFTIEHGYSSSLRVAQFRTDPLYNAQNPYELTNNKTGNYYSRLDIPSVTISEQFSPLIGFTMKTKSDLLFDIEYRKSRDLDLTAGINGATLMEVRSTGIEVGAGYTFKNVVLFKNKKKKSRRRTTTERDKNSISGVLDKLNQDEEDEKKDDDEDGKKGRRGVNKNKGNDLIFAFDISWRDDVTYLHEETQVEARPVRGTRTINMIPSFEYEVNKNFSMRAFVSYRSTDPYATNQFRNWNFQTGLTFRFKLE